MPSFKGKKMRTAIAARESVLGWLRQEVERAISLASSWSAWWRVLGKKQAPSRGGSPDRRRDSGCPVGIRIFGVTPACSRPMGDLPVYLDTPNITTVAGTARTGYSTVVRRYDSVVTL